MSSVALTPADIDDGYNSVTGLIFIFNLIVGTGALAMPAAFAEAGWLLSLVVVAVLAFMSYLTATFVIETMSIANAISRRRTMQHLKRVVNTDNKETLIANTDDDDTLIGTDMSEAPLGMFKENEKVPLLVPAAPDTSVDKQTLNYYTITEKFELGKMSSMFFNKIGVNLFYLCIIIYLYGDLAIYAVAVSKSLRDVACKRPGNWSFSSNSTNDTHDLCWDTNDSITRMDAYRLFLAVFIVCLGPFAFFNMQKTKYLQIFTTLMRWLAFLSMIILALIALGEGKGEGRPVLATFSGVPNLFGVCVYAFMCHHSLPSLVTPIKKKSSLYNLLLGDYLLILSFYSLLSFTGIFTFAHPDDMYTFNFQPGTQSMVPKVVFLQYFLLLFPVFTLSTNFPIISITLRNNLITLALKESKQYPWYLKKLLFPFLAILPPTIVAFFTSDIEILVGVTGSYAGAGIQYVIPALLVYFGRKAALQEMGLGVRNSHESPFRHAIWIVFVLLWALTCVVFVTINHIITGK